MNLRKYQAQFARLRVVRDMAFVFGETVAVVTGALSVVPGAPSIVHEYGLPTAVIFGASVLCIAAIYDWVDPTRPTILFFENGKVPNKIPKGATLVFEGGP